MPYPSFLNKLLHVLPPETAHALVIGGLKWLQNLRLLGCLPHLTSDQDNNQSKLMGLTFKNRVGLAAGFTKDAEAILALSALGFGHIEVGTITPKGQFGNPKPRLFRLKESEAILNRMGFNNRGSAQAILQIRAQMNRRTRSPMVLGVSIGKNASTPFDRVAEDYTYTMDKMYGLADYFAINISSPNTKNLRDIQRTESLNRLLELIVSKRNQFSVKVPLVLKLSPDLENEELAKICMVINNHDVQGVQLSNTTVDHSSVQNLASYQVLKDKSGGLSGSVLRNRSNEVLELANEVLQPQIVRFGIGGIMQGKHALEKYQRGASLVQIYTGFIYYGLPLLRELLDQEYSVDGKAKQFMASPHH